jgi:hypothetical protein
MSGDPLHETRSYSDEGRSSGVVLQKIKKMLLISCPHVVALLDLL